MNQDIFKNLFQIKNYLKTETDLTIEINTDYSKSLQELFLTKKEKNNNKIYDLLLTTTSIVLIISGLIISGLIFPTDYPVTSDPYKTNLEVFGDMLLHIFGPIVGGCISLIILIVLFIILYPVFNSLEKKLVTKIKNITLKFSSNGLEIIPDTPKKEHIVIESLNIKEISIREKEIERGSGRNSCRVRILNIILILHKPIKEQFTNKNIDEIILVENISKDYLEEAIKLAEEMQKSLELTDM